MNVYWYLLIVLISIGASHVNFYFSIFIYFHSYQAVKQIFAAPSSAADGLTDAEYTGAPAIPPSGFFSDMFNAVKKGHLAADLETVLQGLNEFSHPLDDRKLLLEHGVSMLQSLPPVCRKNQKKMIPVLTCSCFFSGFSYRQESR